jgi:hypothetical protein
MKRRTIRRLLFAGRITTATCLLFIVLFQYVKPIAADLYYRNEYRKLTLECDQAMHDEAALRPNSAEDGTDPNLSLSALVGLTVCHEYDKLRKWMLVLGVSEEQLALHGLQALENEQIPVSRMVEPHKMERF